METPLVEVVGVSKSFGNREVLKDVNLSIPKGSMIGLVGQSGSGKTTLLRLILGIYHPSSGKILFHGRSATREHSRRVGFASQEYSFYPRLSVEENVWFYGRMYGLSKQVIGDRMKRLLRRFELSEAQATKAAKLSGGMKRRLDIALALLHNPELVILDEPTTGLDVVLKERIWELIGLIRGMGLTVVVSSHELEELQSHCGDIVSIREGRVYDQQVLRQYMAQHGGVNLSDIFRAWYVEHG